jgi:hypothetical protein
VGGSPLIFSKQISTYIGEVYFKNGLGWNVLPGKNPPAYLVHLKVMKKMKCCDYLTFLSNKKMQLLCLNLAKPF